MSHLNGYADLARFADGAEPVVGDILDVTIQTATSADALVGPPARA